MNGLQPMPLFEPKADPTETYTLVYIYLQFRTRKVLDIYIS
jgi:hypothetical protein